MALLIRCVVRITHLVRSECLTRHSIVETAGAGAATASTRRPPTRPHGKAASRPHTPLRVPPGSRSPKRSACERRRQATCHGGRRAWPHGHSWSAAAATPRHLLAALPFLPPPPPIPQRELFPLPRLFIPGDRGWSRDWCFLLAVSSRPVAMVSSVALLVFGHEHCSHLNLFRSFARSTYSSKLLCSFGYLGSERNRWMRGSWGLYFGQ